MATVQGSFETCKDIVGHALPLQLWKTTVTIAAGATTASIEPSNRISGTVVAVWLDPGTLTASATIKGYSQTDDISTPTYFIDYTVPNPAVETRAALNARLRVFGKLEIDIASATAADSVTIYVWVDPIADTGVVLAAPADGTYIGDVAAKNALATVSATIANGASLSGVVDIGEGRVLCAIDMPADWTAANLTFQASTASDGTFDSLYDQYGTEKTVTAAEDRYIPLDDPAFWLGVRYVKVRSGTAASAVNQGAERVITLVTKPV